MKSEFGEIEIDREEDNFSLKCALFNPLSLYVAS